MDCWKPIATFNAETHGGVGILGYFPKMNCILDMTWMPKHEHDDIGHFVSFGGDGCTFSEQPTHWREMPAPPANQGDRHARGTSRCLRAAEGRV